MTGRYARKRGYTSEEYSLPKSWLDISACLVASITLVGTSVSLFVLGIKVTNSTIEVPYLSAVSFGASAFSFAFALIFAIGAASYWRTSSTVTVVHQMDSQDIQRIANEATHEISRVTGRLEGLISAQGKSLTDHRGVTDTLLPIIEERVREGLSRDSGRGPGGYLPALPEKPELDEIPNLDALANVFKEEVVFRIAGPYPPQQLSSYNEFFVSSPGLIDSAKADSPIGHLDYPRSGVHFFFESELPEVSADSPYSATLWIDGDGDGLDQPAETRVLNVNLVGRVVKTEASLPMFSGIRSFRVDIVAGSATAAQLLGDWDFEGNLPLKTDSTKIPYPLFFGFQPIQGSGSFQLPNLFPQINQSVLTGVVVEGVTWAVRIGPRLDITPTITPSPVQPVTPSPVQSVTATPSPMPTDSGKPPIIKPLWLWMGGIAGVVLLGALLVGWWLSKRQRREDGFSV